MKLWQQILLILFLSLVSALVHSQLKPLDTAELGEFALRVEAFKEKQRQAYLLLDVRDEEAYNQGHITGAIHFDSTDWERSLGILMETYTGEEKLFLYCNSDCSTSKSLTLRLREAGFEEVYYIHGGYDALKGMKNE